MAKKLEHKQDGRFSGAKTDLDKMIGGGDAVPRDVVNVELPIGNPQPDAYVPQHVDVQLNREQGVALKRIFTALDNKGQRLKSGRVVQSVADAVRHMLEKAAEAMG